MGLKWFATVFIDDKKHSSVLLKGIMTLKLRRKIKLKSMMDFF